MDEIQRLAKRLEMRDKQKVFEQTLDLNYYNDTFEVKSIKEPFHVVRTGTATRIINNMVNHIQIANPQVFREPKKNTEGAKESALKVTKFLNYLIENFITEITESVWNASLYGEGVFQIDFNDEAYEKRGKDYVYSQGLPVVVTSIDPLIVHCLPYDSLIPLKVIKLFDMDASEVWNMWPEWSNPSQKKEGGAGAKYLSYWDEVKKYFEADKEVVSNTPNPLKFTPFVHFYSGFGKRSAEGKPESLAVGRLRKIRGRLVEECEIESRIDSIIGLYANPILVVKMKEKDADPADMDTLSDVILAPGINIPIPYGYDYEIYTPEVANAQLFAHLANVRNALEIESPSILSGQPASSRTTGRQEDIEYGHIQRQYSSLLKNMEDALSALMGMALRILDTVPQALPVSFRAKVQDGSNKEESIKKEDIDGYYECYVKLNPDEDLEDTINFQKYRMLVNEGRISWKEFLIKGCKKTEDEAEDIMADALAEQAITTNPQMQMVLIQEAMERSGMAKYLEILKQQQAEQKQMNQDLQNFRPNVRPSEARNPEAADIVRQVMQQSPQGIRQPAGVR